MNVIDEDICDPILEELREISKTIKELRQLNITVKQNEQILYQGKTEDIPKEISEMEYKKIYFEGVDVIVEL